ncbi:MAG: hypothetical protein CMM95_02635 [Rickettsiales bacterium]|nr:hypothetical protein [Rickettsiales bacterium]|tara:strand:- start:387 stop:890 length:504 start_codon:yes stop_codon:yes gene_type:complete
MNEDDWEAFKKEVEPLKDSKIIRKHFKSKSESIINFQKNENEPELGLEKVSKENLEKNTLKKIKRGKIRIDSVLDLHGSTLEESKKQVIKFIEQNYNNQRRLLLIITGKGERSSVDYGWKGKGKLKENVPKWLNSEFLSNKILWFDKATPDKGGDGALLVYLKKIKE